MRKPPAQKKIESNLSFQEQEQGRKPCNVTQQSHEKKKVSASIAVEKKTNIVNW